jgi:hypothetical protein
MTKELVPYEIIEKQIFVIRGKKVMLDKDLAELYGVKTQVLNQAVKRNATRFPDDFMFSLSRQEILRISQIVISSKHVDMTLKFAKNVNAFTEQGVAMLSSALKSERAVQINIQIMRIFVKIREMLSAHKELARKLDQLEQKVSGHDVDIRQIFDAIRQLMEPPKEKRRKIGFEVKG